MHTLYVMLYHETITRAKLQRVLTPVLDERGACVGFQNAQGCMRRDGSLIHDMIRVDDVDQWCGAVIPDARFGLYICCQYGGQQRPAAVKYK